MQGGSTLGAVSKPAGRGVTTPSGVEWRIGRQWIGRRLPRWRRVRLGGAAAESVSMPDAISLEEPGTALLIAVGAVVVAVILIPLLLFGIELMIVGLLIAASILGRGLLGRPWVVRAVPSSGHETELVWRVVGWRRSGRLIDEVAASLESGLAPLPRESADWFAPRRPSSSCRRSRRPRSAKTLRGGCASPP